MALLASFLVNGKGKKLEDFLDKEVFGDSKAVTVMASDEDIAGFNAFFKNYTKGLAVERAAIEAVD